MVRRSFLLMREATMWVVPVLLARILNRVSSPKIQSLLSKILFLESFELSPLEEIRPKVALSHSEQRIVSGKVVGGAVQEVGTEPASHQLSAYWLTNALLSLDRRGGYALTDGKLVSRSPASGQKPKIVFGGTPVNGELYQTDSHVFRSKPVSRSRVPRGIYVGSLAPHNWYHWLIDTLPVINSLANLPLEEAETPILLPSEALSKPAWRDSLSTVLHGRQVLPLSPREFHHVETLVMTDGVTTAFPRPLAQQTGHGRIFLNQDVLLNFKHQVLSELGLEAEPAKKNRRIFLARKQQESRRYNHIEVSGLAENQGFETFYLEDLSFRESVEIFTQAEAIVGPHGAGFANSIFASPGTRILMWTWDDRRGDNWYETLFVANHMKANFLFVAAPSPERNDSDPRNAPYHLPRREFQKGLAELNLG
jgi:hypothetical protein